MNQPNNVPDQPQDKRDLARRHRDFAAWLEQQAAAQEASSGGQPQGSPMSFEEQVNRAFYGPNYDSWKAGQDAAQAG